MTIFGVVSLLPAFSYFATMFLAYILYKTLLKNILMSSTFSFRLNIKPDSNDRLISSSQFKEDADMIIKSEEFYEQMNSRRTVRFFSKDHVPLEIIENIVKTAGTAPGMDETEPWTFVVVSKPEMKRDIRQMVEDDEEINYNKRMGEKWVKDLKKLRTTWIKPYLEDVPYLIIILKQMYTYDELGREIEHHNNELSTGIASGFLLTALHKAGLATVTSTPLNVGPTLRKYLGRPDNEKIILLLAVGYPSVDCTVPDLKRKNLSDIMVLYD